ncbi:MAG: hemerythrin domain-containing protein [Bacteroidales bacterium]
MKPNHTDIYARIHKGLRKALFELSELAGKVNPGSTPEVDHLKKLGRRVFEFLELHAEIEEKFQLPLLEAQNPEFVTTDHGEHQQLEGIIADLKEALDQLSPNRSEEGDFYRYYLELNEFIGKYLLHMNHEETVTAELFLKYCQNEDMQSTIEAINGYTTPDQKFLALSYFMPAISQQERIVFLAGVKAKNHQAFQEMMKQMQPLFSGEECVDLVKELKASL